MRLLGLDLSTRVGWSLWRAADDPSPRFGTEVLPKPYDMEDIAKRTLHLRLWLRDMIGIHEPECVAFEAPWIPMGEPNDRPPRPGEKRFSTTAHTLRLQISLACEVETTAKECNVRRVLEVATSSAKVALAGTARLGAEKKRAMVIAATRRGWRVSNDHEADAGAVCLVAYEHLGE